MASEKMRRAIEHHAPSEKNVREIVNLRRAALAFADALDDIKTENHREFALAETNFEQSVMWAVKSLVLPPIE